MDIPPASKSQRRVYLALIGLGCGGILLGGLNVDYGATLPALVYFLSLAVVASGVIGVTVRPRLHKALIGLTVLASLVGLWTGDAIFSKRHPNLGYGKGSEGERLRPVREAYAFWSASLAAALVPAAAVVTAALRKPAAPLPPAQSG